MVERFFVSAHDDFQKDFAAFGREDFRPMSSMTKRSGLMYFLSRRLSPAWVCFVEQLPPRSKMDR